MNQAVNFSDAASTPFTPSQIFPTAYSLFFKTSLYNNTCREWRRRLQDNKTCANVQANYSAAAHNLCKSQATAQSMEYHSVNAASENTNAE